MLSNLHLDEAHIGLTVNTITTITVLSSLHDYSRHQYAHPQAHLLSTYVPTHRLSEGGIWDHLHYNHHPQSQFYLKYHHHQQYPHPHVTCVLTHRLSALTQYVAAQAMGVHCTHPSHTREPNTKANILASSKHKPAAGKIYLERNMILHPLEG